MTFISTLLWSGLAVSITASLIFLLLKKFAALLETKLYVRLIVTGFEVICAIAATAVANLFDLFKSVTWEKPTPSTAIGCSLMLLIVLCYAGIKILLALTKEKDQKTIVELKAEVAILTKQRDWAAKIRELVTNIVSKKMNRLKDAAKTKGNQFGLADFLEALEPQRQIQVILTALYATIERVLENGHKLRLAVYLPVDGYLKPIYSFDGTSNTCFTSDSANYMCINDPDGAKSVMTKLYHSGSTCRIISDCEAEAKKGEFEYFRPEQKNYIRSMVAAKKTVHYPTGTGKDIVLIAMDTTQNNFFRDEDREEIESCCNEILKRLEFELLCFNIRSSINTNSPNP